MSVYVCVRVCCSMKCRTMKTLDEESAAGFYIINERWGWRSDDLKFHACGCVDFEFSVTSEYFMLTRSLVCMLKACVYAYY